MAKKSSARKTRHRRSPEEIIADLQRKIREVKERAAARELKRSDAVKAALAAVRAIDKGLEAAEAEDEKLLRHALADARRPLADHLGERGVKLPKPRLPRGRRPRKASA